MNSDLIEELRKRIEQSRQAQQQSREYRKRTEELIAEAEWLLGVAKRTRQNLNGRNANSGANSTAEHTNGQTRQTKP